MQTLILVLLAAVAQPGAAGAPTSADRPILIWSEELPRSEVNRIVMTGKTADGTASYRLSIEKSSGPLDGTAVEVTVGRQRFDDVHLPYLRFQDMDQGRIRTYSRIYPHGRVFRIRLRYGEPAPQCLIGDDGSGAVAITYRKGFAPEVEHRPPTRC